MRKKCRLSNDAIATKNVCVAILKLCREKQAWSHLIANSQLLEAEVAVESRYYWYCCARFRAARRHFH